MKLTHHVHTKFANFFPSTILVSWFSLTVAPIGGRFHGVIFSANSHNNEFNDEKNGFTVDRKEGGGSIIGFTGQKLLYNQYRNEKGDNSTFQRNKQIQILVNIPHSCPTNEHTQLFKTLQKGIDTHFKEIEVVVVGRIPAEIESFASKAPMGAIRWWPMEPNDSLETCIQYAKFCSLCTEKVVELPESQQG
ncbi:hypothetical protein [Paenibacillus agricola]|uniref:hypothetical protein n=1 Tax=Paenibacillus agricola TaxID=2716264 RepID=UPI001FB84C00|nr:hypothetical protein [Paenibacillus agricola]